MRFILIAALALSPRFAGGQAPPRPPLDARTLTVFAAASLRDAFEEIGAALKAKEPGLVVQFEFGGSNALALQIGQGAAADVFASADVRWMTYVTDSAHAASASQPFANNRLAVIVPVANPARITRLQDLARSGLKIVLAADAVPAGRYTRDVLGRLSTAPGFDAAFATRVQANTVSREENVKAVVAKVQLGEADAGIVYRSDVGPGAAGKVTMLEIPDAYNVVASYPIAALTRARNAAAARAFVALVLSPEGQGILARHNFIPLPASARGKP